MLPAQPEVAAFRALARAPRPAWSRPPRRSARPAHRGGPPSSRPPRPRARPPGPHRGDARSPGATAPGPRAPGRGHGTSGRRLSRPGGPRPPSPPEVGAAAVLPGGHSARAGPSYDAAVHTGSGGVPSWRSRLGQPSSRRPTSWRCVSRSSHQRTSAAPQPAHQTGSTRPTTSPSSRARTGHPTILAARPAGPCAQLSPGTPCLTPTRRALRPRLAPRHRARRRPGTAPGPAAGGDGGRPVDERQRLGLPTHRHQVQRRHHQRAGEAQHRERPLVHPLDLARAVQRLADLEGRTQPLGPALSSRRTAATSITGCAPSPWWTTAIRLPSRERAIERTVVPASQSPLMLTLAGCDTATRPGRSGSAVHTQSNRSIDGESSPPPGTGPPGPSRRWAGSACAAVGHDDPDLAVQRQRRVGRPGRQRAPRPPRGRGLPRRSALVELRRSPAITYGPVSGSRLAHHLRCPPGGPPTAYRRRPGHLDGGHHRR